MLLREARMAKDDITLIAFLRHRSGDDADPAQVNRLIR
jgi:hypothetical protein